jgi:hypothetical protein
MIKKRCSICNKEYNMPTDINGKSKNRYRLRTCSKECSKKYAKIIKDFLQDNLHPIKRYEYKHRDYLKNKNKILIRNKKNFNVEEHKSSARKWYRNLPNPRKKQLLAREKIYRFIDKNNGVTQTEILKYLNMAYKTIQINCAFLEGIGRIKLRNIGSAKIYYSTKNWKAVK